MATIVTRSGKGSPLTNTEVDANFTNLNNESPNVVLTTQGDLLYKNGATTITRLAKDTTATRYLSNTGTSNNPAWAQVNLTNGVTGNLPLANGGTGASLTDPNADRILFWDDSAGAVTFLTAGTGLTISGTTISASGGVTTGKAIAMAIVFG